MAFTSLISVQNRKTIYIYNDKGVSQESLLHIFKALERCLPIDYLLRKINAQEIIENSWSKDAALLVMPGGADLLYIEKLNNAGNQNIKNYIKDGGSYLGICAGAYYGANYVEFDKGGELEILGKRQLAFFPDKAIGPILAKYQYKSNVGAKAAAIYLPDKLRQIHIFYNGGGYFKSADKYSNVTILGYYENNLPAIVYIYYEKGKVILSGVHIEYDPSLLDSSDIYLRDVLPKLKSNNLSRKALLMEILKKLGINVKTHAL